MSVIRADGDADNVPASTCPPRPVFKQIRIVGFNVDGKRVRCRKIREVARRLPACFWNWRH
jgi:hypothetical protein